MGCEVAQQGICRWMRAESRGDEIEQWRDAGEFASGEVGVADEASVLLMPAHAGLVVESREGRWMSSSAFNSRTARRPPRLQVRTSIMARSVEAKAGTRE